MALDRARRRGRVAGRREGQLTGANKRTDHARDRIYGGGQPFELGYQPDAEDWRRWLLVDAERTVRVEEERLHEPPDD